MKNKLLILAKIIISMLVIADFIMNIFILKSTADIKDDIRYVSLDVSSVEYNVEKLESAISDIKDDVYDIKHDIW